MFSKEGKKKVSPLSNNWLHIVMIPLCLARAVRYSMIARPFNHWKKHMHLLHPQATFDGVMSILATKHSCWAAWYYENSYVFFLRRKHYFSIIGFDSFLLMFNRGDEAVLDIGSNSYAFLRSTRQRRQAMWQKPRVPCEGQAADSSALAKNWVNYRKQESQPATNSIHKWINKNTEM